MAQKQTAGRDRLGHLAPTFAHLNDDVLFGEVWSREDELSARDRSMITIATLSSMGVNFRSAVGNAFYVASKDAIEGYSEILRNEVEPFGISVCVIEPGSFRTEFRT